MYNVEECLSLVIVYIISTMKVLQHYQCINKQQPDLTLYMSMSYQHTVDLFVSTLRQKDCKANV